MPPDRWNRAKSGVVLALLLLAPAAVRFGIPPGPPPYFKGDDFPTIEYVSREGGALHGFSDPLWGRRYSSLYWRPLFLLSFAADRFLFGTDPWGYQLHTLLAHVLVSWLLFALLLRFGLSEVSAGIASFLFALCPVAQASFFWNSARVDAYGTGWLLLGLLLHLRTSPGRLPLAALAAFLAGLASKESAFGFPLVALGADVALRRRVRIRTYAPYGAAAILYLVWRGHVLESTLGGSAVWAGPTGSGGWGWLLSPALPVLRRLGRFLWPVPSAAVAGTGALALGWIFLRALRRGSLRGRVLTAWGLGAAGVVVPVLPALRGEGTSGIELRSFYPVAVVTLAAVALAGRSAPLLAVVGAPLFLGKWPSREMRDQERFARELHRAVLAVGAESPPDTPILLDIPRHRLFWGVDRLHAPPFAPSFRRVLVLTRETPQPPPSDPARWPILDSLRVGTTAEGRAVVRVAGPPPAASRTIADLGGPIDGGLLRSLAAGRISPTLPSEAPPHTRVSLLFLTGLVSFALEVGTDARGAIPLRDLFTASVGGGRSPVPLFSVLPVNLDLELSTRFYLALPGEPRPLLELEFDRSAQPVLLEFIGGAGRPP
ncbi:MAG: hypothetical protein L0323_13825 [Planctomycetes bacterium]|nr:hypothetical protein [Planctomycetota bacterium]